MSPVAAPADRRFRRAHVKPGRRRHDWRRVAGPLVRWTLAVAVLAYGTYRASDAVAHAHVLQIDRIVVRGNTHLSRGEVLALVGGMRGRSLVWADLDRWRTRLLTSPWVRDATLRRALPSTVEVVIAERQPIGIGRIGGEMYLVDEHGTLIDQYGPQYAAFDLPLIDGLAGPGAADGAAADPVRADLAARVIAAARGRPDIARRISQVDVRDSHDATVILAGDTAVLHLGEDQFLPRLEAYLDLVPVLRERMNGVDYVDLRFGDRIYVRPASAPSALRRGGPVSAPSARRRDGRGGRR